MTVLTGQKTITELIKHSLIDMSLVLRAMAVSGGYRCSN